MRGFLKDVSVRSAAFLMAYYVTNSIFQSYMSLYYVDMGLDNTQIGLINSMVALVSVFAMQFWGRMGDTAASRNRLLCLMCVSAAMLMATTLLSGKFLFLLIIACLFASFYTSIQPMGDSIVLASLAEHGRPFGPVRMLGGLSFAVVAMLFGRVLDAAGNTKIVIYAVAGLCLVIALTALWLPSVIGGGHRRKSGKMLSLFKNRDLLRIFLLMIPLQITLGYFYAFFSPLFKNDLPGGNETLLGWCFFISATSEAPFLLLSDRLFDRYGAGRLMCVSAIVMTARWLMVAVAPNAYVAMASQLLHSWSFIVITVTLSKYVQATVPENLRASGQLLISVFGFGVARVIGYFGGGLLSDLTSRQDVFFLCAGICFVCFAVFTPYYFTHKPLNGKNTLSEAPRAERDGSD